MLAIHNLCSTDKMRLSQQYIQVKGGLVSVTDSSVCVQLPVSDVFGEGVIKSTEELYFKAADWRTVKFDKAHHFVRQGNNFTAKGPRDNFIGQMDATSAEDFKKEAGRFPDVSAVIDPAFAEKPALELGINAKQLCTIASIFKKDAVKISYLAKSKVYRIDPLDSDAYACQNAKIIQAGVSLDSELRPVHVFAPADKEDDEQETTKLKDYIKTLEDRLAVAGNAIYNGHSPEEYQSAAKELEISKLTAEIERLKSRLAADDDIIDAAADAANEEDSKSQDQELIDDLRSQIKTLQGLGADTDEELNDALANVEELGSKVMDLERDLSNARGDLASLKERAGELEEYEGFAFRVEDEQQRLLFMEFIDFLKRVGPNAVFDQLQYLKDFA